MPAPNYVGDATGFQIQPGSQLGPEGNLVVYTIPYAGEITTADVNTFRAAWQIGAACPIAGWTHLKLEAAPTIVDEGVKSTAVLRFVGPDTNGDFGAADPEIIEYRPERRSIELDAYDGTAANDWKGVYVYGAQIAIKRYVRTSKASTPSTAPTLDAPTLIALEKDLKTPDMQAVAPVAASVPGATFTVVSNSEFLRQTDTGTGIWEVEEWHEKILQPVPPTPRA